MLASAFTSFNNPYSYERTIRAVDVDLVVTGRGHFLAELTRIDLPHLWIQRGKESLSWIAHTALDKARSPIFFLSEEDDPPMRLSGMELSAGEMVVYSPGSTNFRPILSGLAAGVLFASLPVLAGSAQAQTKKHPKAQTAAAQTDSGDKKPNILFIMTDDVAWMAPSIYHGGLAAGETPNIDRIGQEGVKFLDFYAEQSCTAGRNAFMTGMNPLRTGLIVPQLPGSPSWLRPGTPALGKFLLDLGYNTGQFGKNHLGDNVEALPTAHGFQEYWGYLYHLDAMQQVSFMDVYRQDKNPPQMAVTPPCKASAVPGLPEVPGAVDPATTTCLTPPRPVIWCHSADGTQANQSCQDQGVVTLKRSETLEEEVSAKVIDFLDRRLIPLTQVRL